MYNMYNMPREDRAVGNHRDEWPLERIDRFRELWAQRPMLTCWEIAKELGVGKNAVVGKRKRLGLPLRDHGSNGGRPLKPSSARKKAARERRALGLPDDRKAHKPHWQSFVGECEAIPLPVVPPENAIPLVELTESTCRWPYGERPVVFCGAIPAAGRPYCGPHCRVAYQAGSAGRRA